MDASSKLLSDVVAFRTYSRFLRDELRRESLTEVINRNLQMHTKKFPKFEKELAQAFQSVHDLKVMGSMRGMQYAGTAIERNPVRLFNCSYAPIEDELIFGEMFFILLSGAGFGYSVQSRHVSKLPVIKAPTGSSKFVIPDSIEGWADALKELVNSYFHGTALPEFDFSEIRPKGAYISTIGARAPGPEKLEFMLKEVSKRFQSAIGSKLTPLQVHDILCIVADAVISGGIRKAAMIALFDPWDMEMATCKHGNWWELHPYRGRSNNSAIFHREFATKEEFLKIYEMCEKSGSGEPGFCWTSNYDWGTNPCAEIGLRPYQFCNLTTVNQTGVNSLEELLKRVEVAAMIGTFQATYTDFNYLSDRWKKSTEEEALLGVSFTGIADNGNKFSAEDLQLAAAKALEVNATWAERLGINKSNRVTAVKPEGSSSCVLGSSSGIHARHSSYYIRRVRMAKDSALAVYLTQKAPELMELDFYNSNDMVLSVAQKSPEFAVTRNSEKAVDALNRAMLYNLNWVRPGHREGCNPHNVSVTISVLPEEWASLGIELWANRQNYNGVSLLPADNGTYVQAPFEEISESRYLELLAKTPIIDLTEVREVDDFTTRGASVACAGGVCEIEI